MFDKLPSIAQPYFFSQNNRQIHTLGRSKSLQDEVRKTGVAKRYQNRLTQ